MATLSDTKPVESSSAATFLESPALEWLLEIGNGPDPFCKPAAEIEMMQLQAAREVIASQKGRISVLRRRMEECAVGEVRSRSDLLSLLFPHTVYKSYPISFLRKGQWGKMLKWLGSLSSEPLDAVDIDGVQDVDDFIIRLHEAGHGVMTSSGTSGKVSFLDRNALDIDVWRRWSDVNFCWPHQMPSSKMNFFQLTPRSGPYMAVACGEDNARRFSTLERARWLTEERMRVGDLMRAAEMRTAIAEGTATPGEMATFEEETKIKSARSAAQFEALVDEILDKRHEAMFLMGQAGMLWRMVERGRERGIEDGDFHPDSILATGGGAKGLELPADFIEQIYDFLGPMHHRMNVYGCSEMSVTFPACENGHYHALPWIMPFVLDRAGETLLDIDAEGPVEGRFAFLDLSYTARWGGLITGDKVTLDHSPICECGRPGPVVRAGSIARYSDLGEEDKITCSGTMESYIRGEVA